MAFTLFGNLNKIGVRKQWFVKLNRFATEFCNVYVEDYKHAIWILFVLFETSAEKLNFKRVK